MTIVFWDIDVDQLSLQSPWVSAFGICRVLVDNLECWAWLPGREGVRGRGTGGFLIEAPGWLNNGPFYASKRQTMFSIIRVNQSQETSDD
jgi:hypothetical protein